MHNLHILPSKNVEISTFVNFYQCIFIEYSCIKILYTKYIGKIWKNFGCFSHILPSKNPYISRLSAIWDVMFFWYMHLCTNCMKKNFYAILCIFMHKIYSSFFIYNVAKIVPTFCVSISNFYQFFIQIVYTVCTNFFHLNPLQNSCQSILCVQTKNCYQIFTKTLRTQNRALFFAKN